MRKKRILFSLFAAAFVLSLSVFAAGFFRAENAAAETVTVTIHNGGNGTVTVNDEVIDSGDTTSTIAATVSEGDTLQIKAEAEAGYIFQYWSTDSAGSNSVSMRAEDTFSYEELQAKSIKNLYATYVKELTGELREKAKLNVSYDENLGEVYFFLGNENVTEDELRNHGLPILADTPTDIPWQNSSSVTAMSLSNNQNLVTLAALPNLQGVDGMSVRFVDWFCSYSIDGTNYDNKNLPPYMDMGTRTQSTINGEISAKQKDVGKIWRSLMWACYSDGLNNGLTVGAAKISGWSQNSRWFYQKIDKDKTYGDIIFIENIRAEFQTVVPVPEMHITPMDGDTPKDETTSSQSETDIPLPYDSDYSLTVKIDKLSGFSTPSYSISVLKERDLATGEFNIDDKVKGEWIGDQFCFNVSDIHVNTDIEITPDYGKEYHADPIVIHAKLENKEGIDGILMSDSAKVEIQNDSKFPWYFDPQFNGNGGYAFSSGLNYPSGSILEDFILRAQCTQMHFKVTGSGIFTFEFYLDGIKFDGSTAEGYAGFSTNSPVGLGYSGVIGNELAKGHYYVSDVGNEYQPCDISDPRVTRLQNSNWCVATMNITADADTQTDIYIGHLVKYFGNMFDSMSSTYAAHTVMAVRNVGFYQGDNNVSWGIYNGHDSYGTVTAKINGAVVEEKQSTVPSGTSIEFSIGNHSNYKFYGWSDGTNLLSTDETFTYTVRGGNSETTANVKIEAVLAPEGQGYAYRNGGKFYGDDELSTALGNAKSGTEIYVLKDVTVSGDITIPKNVNLILPFDEAGGINKQGGKSARAFSWQYGIEPYVTMTLANGSITIEGTLTVGAVTSYPDQGYQGHTSGDYAKFVNDGTVTVEKDGYFDIYGLVTGKGGITVENGGKVAEPFLILDFAGGSNTFNLYSDHQTPFNRYAMVNIQCEGGITVNYGGELWGHATLYAMSAIFNASAPVISYATAENDENARGLIMLTEGGSAKIVYTESQGIVNDGNCTTWIGKTKLTLSGTAADGTFKGGAIAKFMSLNVGITISTKDVVAFAVPYNFDIELESGTYTIDGNFKLMPGASLTVKKDATLNINSNFFVYDGLVQSDMSGKSYPTAADLKGAGYTTNANFVVDGTLNINDGATFMGVVQTSGTSGKIVTAKGATLSGTIIDGALGAYDCNYAEFESSARVYDATHETLAKLEAGRTYTAADGNTWTFAGVEIYWCGIDGANHKHADKFTNGDGVQHEIVSKGIILQGSWKVEHDGAHKYDWSEAVGDAVPDASKHVVMINRTCTELGCNEKGHKYLLFVPENIGSVVYKADNFAGNDDDIIQMIKDYYGADVTLTAVIGLARNAGNYNITLTAEDALFGDSYSDSATVEFTITPATLTLTAGKAYSSENNELNLQDNVPIDIIGVQGQDKIELDKSLLEFTHDIQIATPGVYTVNVTGYNETIANYTLSFGKVEKNYVVTPAALENVTITGSASYGETLDISADELKARFVAVGLEKLTNPTLSYNFGGILGVKLAAKADGYQVPVTITYDYLGAPVKVTIFATLKITPAKITVTLKPQGSTYGEEIIVDSSASAWDVTAGAIFDNDDLKITVTKADGVNAGEYKLEAESANPNYDVTFVESVYTIEKKGISGDITISVAGADKGRVLYTGKNISVSASAKQGVKFDIKILYNDNEVSALNKIGMYKVTATVKDNNYMGSNSETFTVYHVKGYTQAVVDQLEKVTELCKKIIKYPEKLTADNFDAVKAVWVANELRDELTAEAQAELVNDLKPYMPLLERWTEAADEAADSAKYEQVIETADDVADSPLSGLFVGFTALSVLAALLIGGKRR